MENLKLRRSARKDSERIDNLVNEFNFKLVPPADGFGDEELICKIIIDKDGNIIAGCDAYVYPWGEMFVDDMWVDEKYRRQGLGSIALQAAEETGKRKGCYLVFLDTWDFQAKPYYLKNGYTVYACIKDNPKGHFDYHLCKRLDTNQPKRAIKEIEYELLDGTEEDRDFIENSIDTFNEEHLIPKHPYIKINRKLVDKDGNVVAAIMAGINAWDIGWIWKIWVNEEYRGQGLGTKLLNHYEKKAKEKGATKLIAEGIYDWNIDFFKKAGYIVAGEMHDLPKGHTFYVVEKDL